MPSSREKRAQRHQSQSKQNVERFSGRGKTTQNIPGAGYREVQLIGNKKYYTPLSDDPNQTFGGSTGDTNITVTGGGGGTLNHGALGGLTLDSHPQYILVDGTRAFTGSVTVGTDGGGYDVTFYSETAGDSFVWDASEELLTITGTDGQVALDVADGDVTIADTLTATNIGAFTLTGKLTAGATEIEGSAFDINGGNIDGATIATSDIDVTGQILALDDDQISGNKVEGGTINSITINTLGGSLDANSQVITNVDIQSGDISGTNIDVTSKTLSLDDDQISGDKVEGGTIASITIDQLGGPMDVNDEELTNVNIDSGDISGTDVDVTSQTLLLDDDQISGDKVEGGAIDAITISQLTGAMDANSQSMTNVNIDSGAIDAVTIGTNSVATRIKVDSLDLNGYGIESTSTNGLQFIASGTGGDLEMDIITGKFILVEDTDTAAQTEFLNSSGNFSITTTDGHITLDSKTGQFYLIEDGDDTTQTEIDVDSGNGALTITSGDSGDITLVPGGGHVYVNDGTYNIIELDGANPSITIKDDTTPADNFKIDVGAKAATTISTVDTTGANGHLTLDIDGDIILSADGDQITMDDGTTTRFTFNVDSTPELDVTGDFILDGSGYVKIDATGNFYLDSGGRPIINADAGSIWFHNYDSTFTGAIELFEDYKIHNLANKYHFTTGNNDFKENFSLLAFNFESAEYNEDFGS